MALPGSQARSDPARTLGLPGMRLYPSPSSRFSADRHGGMAGLRLGRSELVRLVERGMRPRLGVSVSHSNEGPLIRHGTSGPDAERRTSLRLSNGEAPERPNVATFSISAVSNEGKLIRGHSMPNQPAIPSNESTPKTAPGNAQDSGFAGSRHGSVSPRRAAADGRPGKLHPVD